MNLVRFKDSKFAPARASVSDFNAANFEPTTLSPVRRNEPSRTLDRLHVVRLLR